MNTIKQQKSNGRWVKKIQSLKTEAPQSHLNL